MAGSPDIDIDFADRNKALTVLQCSSAMVLTGEKRSAHPSGVYFQDVAIDPFTGLASLDYKTLDSLGYFKVDLLNQSVYRGVEDEEHLVDLLNTEPEWSLLEEKIFVQQLPHIHAHFDVVQEIKPKSINDLAVVLALIRPGKRRLLGRNRNEINTMVWEIDDTEAYSFKRAHAISYAALIVVQMNLLVRKMLAEMETKNSSEWNILD